MSRSAKTDHPGAPRWPASRLLLNVFLYLPLCIQAWRYGSEAIYYGEMVHWSGDWSAWLLLGVLAISTARALFRQGRLTRCLLQRRRDLGIASFVYAAVHTAVYLARKADPGSILGDAVEWGMTTGWLALILFLPLFLTSNDVSVRALRGNWKRLHRLVYPAAVLVMLHWYGTAFSPVAACWNAAILLLLLVFRFARRFSFTARR